MLSSPGALADASADRAAVPVRPTKGVFTCPQCGERVRLKSDQPPLCPTCGKALTAPATVEPRRIVAPSPVPVPAEPQPLIAGSDADDDQPYTVPGDPEQTEPCPQCNKPLPRGAVVCFHCGFDRTTGKKIERVYQKVDKHWAPGLPLRTRLGIVLGVEALALVVTLGWVFAGADLFALLLGWIIGAALLAFVLGTYPQINLRRNSKGRAFLTKALRICFIPLAPAIVDWRKYEGVVTGKRHDTDVWDWLIVVMLLPYGVFPALLWWIYVIRPDQFHAALSKDHGFPALLLYRGHSADLAKEIAVAIHDVTGLPYDPLA